MPTMALPMLSNHNRAGCASIIQVNSMYVGRHTTGQPLDASDCRFWKVNLYQSIKMRISHE